MFKRKAAKRPTHSILVADLLAVSTPEDGKTFIEVLESLYDRGYILKVPRDSVTKNTQE